MISKDPFMRGFQIYALGFFLTAAWLASAPCPTNLGNPHGDVCGDRMDASVGGMFVAFFWPHYWATEGFRLIRN